MSLSRRETLALNLTSLPALGLGILCMFLQAIPALTFFVVRATDARVTGALSGMAQSFGYLLAATGPLLVGLGLIVLFGLVVLYSASGQDWNRVINASIRVALGPVAMCALAQVKPAFLRRLSPVLWVLGVVLLIIVDITGHIGKGAQRWLDIGFRFQPSEIMKLAVPMCCAWWLHDRPLPPDWKSLLALGVIIFVPSGTAADTLAEPGDE